ncbi:MAG: protein kinase, partial [Dehalococcoidia bacterium]|nr:protein kinase [Dehalococcoidia bacterium]
AALLRLAPLPADTVLAVLGQLADALDYLAGRALAHHNVSPSTVFINERDQVTITDFGLRRALRNPATALALGPARDVVYIAPELLLDRPADAAADRFSLGALAFVMLTGVEPFDATTPQGVLEAMMAGAIVSASRFNPALPAAIDSVFAKALARDPEERYPTAAAFVAAVTEALTHAETDAQQRVGPYRILNELARTAVYARYTAQRDATDATVDLLKINLDQVLDADLRTRYEVCFPMLREIAHPNLVKVHEVWREGDVLVVVADPAVGVRLNEVMRGGPVHPARALTVLGQAADALDALYAKRVLADALDAEDIVISETDFVTLRVHETLLRLINRPDLTTAPWTRKLYQSDPKPNDDERIPRADGYALGIVAHLMLTGQLPARLAPKKVEPKEGDNDGEKLVRTDLPEAAETALRRQTAITPGTWAMSARDFVGRLAQAFDGLLDLPWVASSQSHAFNRPLLSMFGKYEVLAEYRRHEFGHLFAARHVTLDRPASLLVVDLTRVPHEAARARFLDATSVLTYLDHPHLLFILSAEETQGYYAIAAEPIVGRPLSDLLATGPMPAQRALPILEKVAAVLDYTAAKGVVVPRVAVEDIYLGDNDEVKVVAHLGVARYLWEDRLIPDDSAPKVTGHGPAPVVSGIRNDAHSLGWIANYLLTGQAPPKRERQQGKRGEVYRTQPVAYTLTQLPAGPTQVLQRQMDKDPGRWYPNATTFVSTLKTAMQPKPKAWWSFS